MTRYLNCIIIGMVLILSIGYITPALAKNYNNKTGKASNNNDNPKYASLIMDADTGQIISQRYADKVVHPASLTKMMTMLLAFEALDRGDISPNTRIRISKQAVAQVPSKLGLPVGATIRMDDALKALATKSANDIAVAVAEHLGGTESRFASMMTTRAHSIGMSQSRFKNASGLHHASQVTTARDMAKLGQYILKRYSHYYKYFSTRSFTYQGKTYKNHNKLLESYKGMDGFKTGYINASGFNLVASAYRNGHRLIGVVFGGRSGQSRNDHMASLLDEGFKKTRDVRTANTESNRAILSSPSSTPPIPSIKPASGSKPQITRDALTPVVETYMQDNTNNHPSDNSAAYASLSSLSAKPKTKITTQVSNTALSNALENGMFKELANEPTTNAIASKRLETGLIAVAVHKGEYNPNPQPSNLMEQSIRAASYAAIDKMTVGKKPENGQNTDLNQVRSLAQNGETTLAHPKDIVGKWSVQIGAYQSRVKTDEALREAIKKLPSTYSHVNAMTVPLNTGNGMMFRARLGGLDQNQAREICRYFSECLPIAPIATSFHGQ